MRSSKFILNIMVAILLLLFISLVMGCVTEKEVVYKTIYFADTNGVTTVYYPLSMEKDLITPHDDERWKYVASKDSPDKGIAKEMVITDEDMKWYSEEYHRLNPECTYDFQTYSH